MAELLEGKSPQDIWPIICALANQNAVLLNTINLNCSLVRTDIEVDILKGEFGDMVALKNEFSRLLEVNKELRNRIEYSEMELASIKEGLSVRGIGYRADYEAIKQVFPNATKKPFSILSLSDFVMFVEDPVEAASKGLCPYAAIEAWHDLGEIEIDKIKETLAAFIVKFPDLLFSIKTLKEDWEVAQSTSSVSESIEYFRQAGDDTMVDAIELCAKSLVGDAESRAFS